MKGIKRGWRVRSEIPQSIYARSATALSRSSKNIQILARRAEAVACCSRSRFGSLASWPFGRSRAEPLEALQVREQVAKFIGAQGRVEPLRHQRDGGLRHADDPLCVDFHFCLVRAAQPHGVRCLPHQEARIGLTVPSLNIE